MYYVYVMQSIKDNRYYIGHTNDLSRRLEDHNRGKSKAVKHRAPFKLIFSEECLDKIQAVRREKQIKSYKGGRAFKQLITEYATPSSSPV